MSLIQLCFFWFFLFSIFICVQNTYVYIYACFVCMYVYLHVKGIYVTAYEGMYVHVHVC